jgi:hypothetical protein
MFSINPDVLIKLQLEWVTGFSNLALSHPRHLLLSFLTIGPSRLIPYPLRVNAQQLIRHHRAVRLHVRLREVSRRLQPVEHLEQL